MTLLSAISLLFLVMDPFGNIPTFLSTVKEFPPERQRRIIRRELLIALAALLLFLFSGSYILAALHVTSSSLSISGGFILILIALRMIFPERGPVFNETVQGEPFIIPLAIPLIAGPSAMATTILLMANDPARCTDWLLAVIIAWGLSGIILLSATAISKILGERGLTAMERLMGLLLTTVAVEMLVTGIKAAFVTGNAQ